MICPECAKEIGESSSKCPECGFPLGKAASPQVSSLSSARAPSAAQPSKAKALFRWWWPSSLSLAMLIGGYSVIQRQQRERNQLITSMVVAHQASLDSQRPENEKAACAALRMIAFAEADFFSNDRDGNKINDYWTADVSGLYRCTTPFDRRVPIKLIAQATSVADICPLKDDEMAGELVAPLVKEAQPDHGYYFCVLRAYESPQGLVQYGPKSRSRYGFTAVPIKALGGGRSVIISETGKIYAKETAGNLVQVYPLNPAADGWTPVE